MIFKAIGLHTWVLEITITYQNLSFKQIIKYKELTNFSSKLTSNKINRCLNTSFHIYYSVQTRKSLLWNLTNVLIATEDNSSH